MTKQQKIDFLSSMCSDLQSKLIELVQSLRKTNPEILDQFYADRAADPLRLQYLENYMKVLEDLEEEARLAYEELNAGNDETDEDTRYRELRDALYAAHAITRKGE